MPDSRDRSSEPDRWKGYAFAVLAATCWATGGVIAKWLMSTPGSDTSGWVVAPIGIRADATALAGARAAVSFGILVAYLCLRSRERLAISLRDLPFLGFFGIVALALLHVAYYRAISYTGVATAILLEYLAPVIVLVLSVLLLGERFTWALPGGVALSIAGCALVVGGLWTDSVQASGRGVAWGLAAAALFATYQLLGKWASTRFHPWTLLSYGLGSATVFWLVYLHGPGPIIAVCGSWRGAAAIGYLALVSTVIPFAASLKALHYIEATKAVVTSTLEPVIAGAIAWVALGERMRPSQLLGAFLVLAAVVVVQRGPRATQSIPPAP